MGLDMYFYGQRYLWDFGDNNDGDVAKAIGNMFPELKGRKAKKVEVEFMYWRKANAIHKWFVDNVQDGRDECQESYVESDKLYQLRDVCRAVLADTSQASTLLPTTSGFFFGSTDYDEWFFQDVENTVKFLDELLEDKENLKHWDFYYRSSW
jgi:hypothetical protein